MQALTKLLSLSTSLTSVGVCWNAIEKMQAIALARAAVSNPAMVELGLSCNTCLLEQQLSSWDFVTLGIARRGFTLHAMGL